MNVEKIEAVFFNVLEDICDYLPDLTLVGGWMPYVYSSFLWKTSVRNPVTTVDIDFGVDQSVTRDYSRTIFETLSSLDYKEHHLKMDRMFPINKIDKFDFLLKHRISISVHAKKKNKSFLINCPKPSAFLYHKGATFIDRENKEKQAKDLYYMYFILRYAPDMDLILREIFQYRQEGHLISVPDNMDKFFERVSSQGCLLVEQENGPDEYIHDVRHDIFDRFKRLRETLQRGGGN
ncbi:MAG: hypothetical protein HYW85_04020 [Deltaproteobacteria bacterium]|nr:hypothetical protein [Deltaproteobacteria bacterium]